jgi:hypothetical protein
MTRLVDALETNKGKRFETIFISSACGVLLGFVFIQPQHYTEPG